MHLNRPHPVQPCSSSSDGRLSPRELAILAQACRATSKELQGRLSISSNSSDPGMMCDPFNSSGSDTSFEDSFTLNLSEADLAALQEENETWDLYWNLAKDNLPSHVDAYRSPPQNRGLNLSPCGRNFASSQASTLSPEYAGDLRRSDALRGSRRANTPSQTQPPLFPLTTYSPFSAPASASNINHPQSQPQPHLRAIDSQHTQHKSWPTRVSSAQAQKTRPPLRARAHTTPGPPSKFTPNYPSNLSTCTTLDYQTPPPSSTSTANSSGLYMRSAPPSPAFTVNETSWFEFDEEEEQKGIVGSLRNKLHIRSASSHDEGKDREGGGVLVVEVRRGKKRTRRSLSEVMKGVFRTRKKGGTL